MLAQQLRNSGSLLDSVDAIRNWRAVGVLLATFVCMALVVSVGGLLSQVSYFFTGVFMLAAYAVFFYGANAVGMMMMDEAQGHASRPAAQAISDSLATSHRLILVFLLLAGVYLAGFLALAVVLFICKIPFIGPILYTAVFPIAVVVSGLALFAVPTVIFPLSAPAIWGGARTMECISQLLAIVRKRLVMVLLLMVAVSLIATVVGMLIGAILFTGTAATALVSIPVLGDMPGVVPGLGRTGVAGALMASGNTGHAVAAMIGGGMLIAVAFTLPGMVYLRGASMVYLQAVDGLDMVSEQADMDSRIATARERARAVQAQAQAAAQNAASAAQSVAQRYRSAAADTDQTARQDPTMAGSPYPPARPGQDHVPPVSTTPAAPAPQTTPPPTPPMSPTPAPAPAPALHPAPPLPDLPPASTPGTDLHTPGQDQPR